MTGIAGPSILVIGHSPYAADRGKQLCRGRLDTAVICPGPGLAGARRAAGAVLRARPRVVYAIDIGKSTTVAVAVARLIRSRVIVDTGDVAFALARSTGARRRLSLALVWLGEQLTLRLADQVIVRGREHLSLVPGEAAHVPDVAPDGIGPRSGDGVRAKLGLHDEFVVGLVGSMVRADRLGVSYGWDLVEAMALTPPEVHAVLVGDGDGRRDLEARARALGVEERCHFVGRVPPPEAADWIGAMDAALSTQSNDTVGAVRTTGKLPLYLACGCPVLASDVGEARRLLGPLGWTLPYDGVVDRGYPSRLARRIVDWKDAGEAAAEGRREAALALSRREFDPEAMRARLRGLVDRYL